MRLLVITLLATACSGGADSTDAALTGDAAAGGDATAGVDSAPEIGGGCAAAVQVGRFEVTPRGVSGSVASRPSPPRFNLERELTSGVCELWSASPSFCDPACTTPQQCEAGVCVDPPTPLSIGTLTATGPGGSITGAPTVPGSPYYSGSSKTPIYAAGDAVQIAATGDGSIAAFTAELVGHEPVVLTNDPPYQLTLVEGEGLTMTWTPSSSPGARVLLHMDSDHHGAPGYIECETDDADGQIVVDATLGDRILEIGASGIGTYVENAYVVRDHRARVDTAVGCVELATTQQDFVNVEEELNR